LILLHVARGRSESEGVIAQELSVAEAMHRLERIVPSEEALWSETLIRYGSPADEFLKPQDRRRCAESGVDGARQRGMKGFGNCMNYFGTSSERRRSRHDQESERWLPGSFQQGAESWRTVQETRRSKEASARVEFFKHHKG